MPGILDASDGPEFGTSQGPISERKVTVNAHSRRDGRARRGGVWKQLEMQGLLVRRNARWLCAPLRGIFDDLGSRQESVLP